MMEQDKRNEKEDPSPVNPGDRPDNPPSNPKVVPLDEDESIKEGIEVKET